jgi:hypothetical protein
MIAQLQTHSLKTSIIQEVVSRLKTLHIVSRIIPHNKQQNENSNAFYKKRDKHKQPVPGPIVGNFHKKLSSDQTVFALQTV